MQRSNLLGLLAGTALAVLLAYMGAITLGFNTVDRLREDSAVTAEQ